MEIVLLALGASAVVVLPWSVTAAEETTAAYGQLWSLVKRIAGR